MFRDFYHLCNFNYLFDFIEVKIKTNVCGNYYFYNKCSSNHHELEYNKVNNLYTCVEIFGK